MFKWLKDAFRFDGIQDNELPADSDWHYLSPMERIGIQTQDDADIAKKLIAQRKQVATYNADVTGADDMGLPTPITSKLAECNWTCARASTCHEYDCDGESHFVPRVTPNVEVQGREAALAPRSVPLERPVGREE